MTQAPAVMDQQFIVTVTLPGTPEHFSKVCQGQVVVGRNPEVDLQLVHPMVSRRHAEITFEESGCFLVSDLGSSNGTVINDELLQDASKRVEGRVVVQIGPYILRLSTNADVEAETFMADQRQQPLNRVSLDRSQRVLIVDGKIAVERLTGLEFKLLEVLTDAESKLVENQALGDAVWGAGLWDTYMLHNLVRRVRRKLEEKNLEADEIIIGVPRAGYRVA